VTFTGLSYAEYEVLLSATATYNESGTTTSQVISVKVTHTVVPPDVEFTAGTESTPQDGETVYVKWSAKDWDSIKGTFVISSKFTQKSGEIPVEELDYVWEEYKSSFKASTYTAVLKANLVFGTTTSVQTKTAYISIPLSVISDPKTISFPDVQLKNAKIKYDGAKKATKVAAVLPGRLASIQWLASTGITLGSGSAGAKATFKPQDSVTRGAMAQFLQKLAGYSDSYVATIYQNHGGKFSDVAQYKKGGKNENIARYNAITWLDNFGITSGCNKAGDKFCPNSPVNRGAMAQFMHRFVNLEDAPALSSEFPDVNTKDVKIKYDGAKKSTTVKALDASRIEAINWLASIEVTQGSGTARDKTTFKPQDPVTRGAMAQFMHKLAYQLGSTAVIPA
jgi:hypothetical protein